MPYEMHNKEYNDFIKSILSRNNRPDMVFLDPPFNLDVQYGDSVNDSIDNGIYLSKLYRWVEDAAVAVKPGGWIILHHMPYETMMAGAQICTNHWIEFAHWIAWDAPSGARPKKYGLYPRHYAFLVLRKRRMPNDRFSEYESTFHRIREPHVVCRHCKKYLSDYGGKEDKRNPGGRLISDICSTISRSFHKKGSPRLGLNQLPIEICRRLVLTYTDPGQTIIDPFCGTASMGIASLQEGRNYTGNDLVEATYKNAIINLDLYGV